MNIRSNWLATIVACLIYSWSIAATIYVDHSATGVNDGTSWANAYTDLQSAISASVTGDELWVAKGTYYPTTGTNVNVRFEISKGISVYGHFDGTEQSLGDRNLAGVLDHATSRTVLSGNIGDPSINSDNSKTLIRSTYGSAHVLIDGISISDAYGFADGNGINAYGGSGSLTVRNTLFYNNKGTYRAAGMAVHGYTTVLVENCRFKDNSSTHATALLSVSNSEFTIRNSEFDGNHATTGHSAIYNHSTNKMVVENCSFTKNTFSNANQAYPTCISGYREVSITEINNCIFWDNGSTTKQTEIQAHININVQNSIVEGGYLGTVQTGVINQDPQWIGKDLNLHPNSPAVDAGNNALYTGAATDIDGDQRIQNTTIDIGAQEGPIDPTLFITTWSGTTVTIPIKSGQTYNYTVDWDDGTAPTTHTASATHTYTDGLANHTIQISGTFPAIQCYTLSTTEQEQLLSIDQWGTGQWNSMEYAFAGCSNMTYAANDVPNLSNATHLTGMFQSCSSFNGDVSNWDVSNINHFTYLFRGATIFNQDISGWNMSNATHTNSMFERAIAFDQDVKDWDVSNVIRMDRMFYYCHDFNSDLSDWDVSSVESMFDMFNNCYSFTNGTNSYNGKSINSWVTTSLNYSRSMFRGSTAFNRDISNWDMDQVTDIRYMFKGASSFNQDISGWDVSSVTHMQATFAGATAFNQDLKDWEVDLVTNMAHMFSGCSSFNSDLSDWNVSNVTSMQSMFMGCSSFTNGSNSYNGKTMNSWVTSSLNDAAGLFNSCSAFDCDISNWDMDLVTSVYYMFSNASTFNQSLGNWDIGSVTNASMMLYKAGLDECNYDATLNGWNANHQSLALTLDAQNIQYDDATSRIALIGAGWTINDGGQGGSCSSAKDGNNATSELSASLSSMYPNPAEDHIMLQGFEGTVSVTLTDLSGRTVYSGTVTAGNRMDVQALPSGTYIVRAQDNNGQHLMEKLIVN